jgi:type VI secretion system protein ImpK
VNKFSQTVMLPQGAPPPPTGLPVPPPVRYPPATAPARSSGRPAPHPLAGPMYWACSDLLTLACQLSLGAVPPPAAEVRRHVDDLLRSMQGKASEAGIPPEDVSDAVYAIMALFDEILVSANWPGRMEWQTSPLQYIHFHENTAGDGFFRRAEALMRQPHRVHVLQVYFLCLALGFQGRYALSGGMGLAPVYESIGNAVGNYLPPTELLSPHGEPADRAGNLYRQEAPIVRIALGLLGFGLLMFLCLRLVLSVQVSSAVQPMRDYASSTVKR